MKLIFKVSIDGIRKEFVMKKQWKIKICITASVCVWILFGCVQNNQEKLNAQALDMETYEEIDYEKMQGEEYYFYLFADCFLMTFQIF